MHILPWVAMLSLLVEVDSTQRDIQNVNEIDMTLILC